MQKALFLDRDGVINIDYGHVHNIDQLTFVDGIFNFTKLAQNLGYKIFIVTNQAGIAKGLYTEEEFLKFQAFIESEFAKNGVIITKTYYCPHHPDYGVACQCRKPASGMLQNAIKEFNILPEESVLIGDNITDIIAAQKAGITNKILLNIENKTIEPQGNDFLMVKSLTEAARCLQSLCHFT